MISGPEGSTYCPFKDSGSKNYTRYVFLEPESLNGQYTDPLGDYSFIKGCWKLLEFGSGEIALKLCQ